MKYLRCLMSITRQLIRPVSINLLKSNKFCVTFPRRYCTDQPVNSQILSQSFDEPTKKYIEFTCKHCNTRVKKTFSKVAHEKGVVIIRCDGCESLHLVADNLGWITDDKKWKIENVDKIEAEDENNCTK